jgi:hypothetical protein
MLFTVVIPINMSQETGIWMARYKKVKLSLCFNWAPRHEGVLESGGITPHILALGTRWKLVVSFTPRPLYPQGKSPWYPLDRRLGGPQNWSDEGLNFVYVKMSATGWTIGVLGFEFWRVLGIFLFTVASRTALGPTQPPIQWVPGALSLGVKRLGREADHSPSSSAEVKECVELHLHSPIRLHGVALS